MLASLAFVGMFYSAASDDGPGNPGWLLFLAAFVAVHYLTVRAMLLIPQGLMRSLTYYAWFLAMVATFLVVKRYLWLTAWLLPGSDNLLQQVNRMLSGSNPALPVVTLGLSFLIFRQIHFAIEVRDGLLKRYSTLDYLSYMACHFWTSARRGRSSDFEPFCAESSTACHRRHRQEHRVVRSKCLSVSTASCSGYLKVFTVGAWFGQQAMPKTFTHHPDASHFALFLLAYPLFMYFNFTGYCDIVIGIAHAVR